MSDHGISIIFDGQVRLSPPKSTMKPILPPAAAADNAVAHFAASIAPGGEAEAEELSLPPFSERQEQKKAKSRGNKRKGMDLCTKGVYR